MSAANFQTQNRLLIVLSTGVAAFLIWLNGRSIGLEGGMDSYEHYLIARYSFQHPSLLLHYWGKPLYNLLASPFAQFGLNGSFAFNLICLIGASVFSMLTARKMGLRYPFLAYLFCLLSPIFLDNVISSLTEPLNALFLSATLFLFSNRKYGWASVLAGFLPYVRTEGFVLLAVIGLFLLIKRQYRSLLLILVGSLFFDLMGFIIEGKPFWIITDNPYIQFELSGRNVCGSGPLWHYARWAHVTFGKLTSLLLILGSALVLIRSWRFRTIDLRLLVLALFAAYFLAHSSIWALGMMGSCGLIRVMLVISPLAALLAAMGFEDLVRGWSSRATSLALLVLIGNALYAPWRYYHYKYPLQISNEQQEFTRTFSWLSTSEYADRPWAYLYPYLSILADRDPWDPAQHIELWGTSLPYMAKGTIVIWDGHFGANEAGIAKEDLLSDPDFRLLKHIEPEHAFRTLNDHPFEILVFEKLVSEK